MGIPAANPPKIRYDGSLTIAVGRSRKETDWKNREMLWSQLVEKLSRTVRTHETYEEYKRLPRSEQDHLKDVGGFVGGVLKGGRRKTEAVTWRQVITLDADFVQGDFWAAVEVMLGCGCLIYSTHKHSPAAPRLRLVLPLTRPVAPDEYQALARRIAADLGIDFFDDTTYQPHRLMYWPSTAQDGEYVFKYLDEPWLDPDATLARYPDWRDQSYWPESSRTRQERKKLADKQGDPTAKAGIVGAFCRTYSIPEAIEKFLGDVYAPCDTGRYTYIAGSSVGGLVVYDNDLFAYSHHGTDPISSKLVNAFDLVRLHKFGDRDEDAEPGTPPGRLPSYTAMLEFCQEDEPVKATLGEELLAKARDDFESVSEDWAKRLEFNKKGQIVDSLSNLVLILCNDQNLQGIAYNAHRGFTVLVKPLLWRKPEDDKGPNWSDSDDHNLQVYLERVYKLYSPTKLSAALDVVSHERSFHPIREYLEGLPAWDGIPRLEELLIDYLGAANTPYVRTVTRKLFIAAIARVMEPGCKFDYMLVLVGKQGIGKTTLFTRLAGNWFSDSLNMNDMKDKTAVEKLQGYWIMEIGELAGMKKAEVESVKAFLSRQRDIYRPSYHRHTVEQPRQCVIVGSTNNDTGFLRDSTGNRRFWPVTAMVKPRIKTPWDLDGNTARQVWAEAQQAYKAGEKLHLEDEIAVDAYEQQKAAMESDERLGLLEEYLGLLLPEDWEEKSLNERRLFIHGGDFGQMQAGTVRRDRICVAEIWCELFGKDLASIKRYEIDDIHGMLRQIDGWEKYQGNRDGKIKFKLYGVQRSYSRKRFERVAGSS